MFVQPYTRMWKYDRETMKLVVLKTELWHYWKVKTGIGVKRDSEKCKNACEKSPVHKPTDTFSSGKLQVIDQLLIFLKTR